LVAMVSIFFVLWLPTSGSFNENNNNNRKE
jgi:hypothetical protein